MKLLRTLFLLLLAPIGTFAGQVGIALHERATNETSYFAVAMPAGTVSRATSATGRPLLSEALFTVRDGKLLYGNAVVTEATEVLYQGSVESVNLAIIRQEYNSSGSPMRWLAALSGHPVQVSRIVLVQVRRGELPSTAELARKPSSYKWSADVNLVQE